MATISPSLMPVTTAWLSLRRTRVDIVRNEAIGTARVDEGAAVAFEQGLGRNPEHVVERVDGDHHVGGHAGAQFGGGLIEGDAALEAAVPGRAAGAADILDLAGEGLAGEGDDAEGDLLADGEVAAVEFADVGADFPVLEVGNLGHRHAGARGVAELEGRQLHAVVDHVLIGVLLDVDVAGGLGLERHVLDVLAGDVGHDFGFVFLRPSGY